MGTDSGNKASPQERKLAAILFADIQDYTALMQKDETLASLLLKRFQQELVQAVQSRNGQVVNFYGDGALCTFGNPHEAIQCAMACQSVFQTEPAVPVRIGIHVGTIVVEDGKAYGDSINIASRIESLGIPGSILLSKKVHDELKNQSGLKMTTLGRFAFKNVEEPMETFALANPGYAVPTKEEIKGKLKARRSVARNTWYALAFIVFILLAGTIFIFNDYRSHNATGTSQETEQALPTLAVLPFSNLHNDPDADFLGMALADEIIGHLSYINDILVRPSSAIIKYDKAATDAATAGDELKVDYILAGNYLREEGVIRLNVELVGVQSNTLVWREEIEEQYQNAFQLQDMVSEKVLQGLQIQFSQEESKRRTADIPDDPIAYQHYLRALAQPRSIQGYRKAIELLNMSLELDSLFAPTWSELGWRIKQLAAYSIGEGLQINDAESMLQKALELNSDLLSALGTLVAIYVETGRTDKAVEAARHALAINPNSAEIHFFLGYAYRYAGMLVEAEKAQETAMRLDPANPRFSKGLTQVYQGKLNEALEQYKLSGASAYSLAWQGQIHLRLGDRERAIKLFDSVLEMDQDGVGHWVVPQKSYLEGQPEMGLQALLKLEEHMVDAEQIYNVANLYGLLGYKTHCLRTLRQAVSRGFFCYPVFLNDKFLDPVRSEPEFLEVLEEARIKHEAFSRRYF